MIRWYNGFSLNSLRSSYWNSYPTLKYYGNDDQKKNSTGLVSGELKGAYCLTEPDSGSDANSGKSKAILNSDKSKYIINGQKM